MKDTVSYSRFGDSVHHRRGEWQDVFSEMRRRVAWERQESEIRGMRGRTLPYRNRRTTGVASRQPYEVSALAPRMARYRVRRQVFRIVKNGGREGGIVGKGNAGRGDDWIIGGLG